MTQSAGQLAVIATPIGNLGDLSPRAAEWLQKADILACEDTRMTRKLMTLTGLRTVAKFMSYHDHNGQTMRPKLLEALQNGKIIALLSDAGTPLVSDPGYKLVAACHNAGISVTAIPGPSAVLAGLAAAGLPRDRYIFAGFVPNSQTDAETDFRKVANHEVTSIRVDITRRHGGSLQIMLELFGDRLAVVARELTKLHESYHRDTLARLAKFYQQAAPPKGEIIILVSGKAASDNTFDNAKLTAMLREEMQATSLSDAEQTVSQTAGQSRNTID